MGIWRTACLFALLALLANPDHWHASADCSSFKWAGVGPANQLTALQQFYTATQGPQWFSQQGWNSSQTADFCTWEGISCCDGTEVASDESPACAYVGSVEFLTLPSNNLQGTIPDSFWTELGCTLAEITLNGRPRLLLVSRSHQLLYISNVMPSSPVFCQWMLSAHVWDASDQGISCRGHCLGR